MHFILLLALLVQALIPVGFMPGRAVAGTYMEICTPEGMILMNVDPAQEDNAPDADHGHSKPCVYSLMPVAADVPQALLTANAVATVRREALYFADYIMHAASVRALPPATAPPVVLI